MAFRKSKKKTRNPYSYTDSDDADSSSGSEWTDRQLRAFGIFWKTVSTLDEMFSQEERNAPMNDLLSLLQKSWPICVNEKKKGDVRKEVITGLDERIQYFWVLLSEVQDNPGIKTKVKTFIYETFRLAQLYRLPDIVLGFSIPLQLRMAGESTEANPDLLVIDNGSKHTILLVNEDKSEDNVKDDPFAQVVAEGIAAFQKEQNLRIDEQRPLLSSFPILLGVCKGTIITFLRAEIPAKLIEMVEKGERTMNFTQIMQVKKSPPYRFESEDEFQNILRYLCCWRHIILNSREQLKEREKQ